MWQVKKKKPQQQQQKKETTKKTKHTHTKKPKTTIITKHNLTELIPLFKSFGSNFCFIALNIYYYPKATKILKFNHNFPVAFVCINMKSFT